MYRLLVLSFLLASTSVSAQTTVLEANFDSKTVDAPAGKGGPAVGEPDSADPDIQATIRATPFATLSLEMQDTVDFGARFVRFTFLPGAEISTGIVSMHMDLWFTEMNSYLVYVREHAGNSLNFLSLRFEQTGLCVISDKGGLARNNLNTYTTDKSLAIDIVYDMDVGTYDLSFDGVLVVDDEPHNVDAGRGVGSIAMGTNNDSDLVGTLYADNILVTSQLPTPIAETSLGELKSLYQDTAR